MQGLYPAQHERKDRRKREARSGARLVDVATAAGVSPMTASRALRTPDLVASETYDRVLKNAIELGYIPDLNARGLKSQRTGLMAAIIPTITNSLMASVIKGMSDVLNNSGFQLLLGNSGFSLDDEEKLVSVLLARRPDALYLTGTLHKPETLRLLERSRIPVVEGGNLSLSPIDSVVGLSNVDAARSAVEHLISRGHRNIGCVVGRMLGNDRMNDRHAGYRQALEAAGISYSPDLVCEVEVELEGGAQGMRELLERAAGGRSPHPTAVFCTVDTIAAGAVFECQRRRIAIPDDIAIAGFGDLSIASQIVPALTTVRVPGQEIGRIAAETMIARCNGAEPVVHDVGHQLVIREST